MPAVVRQAGIYLGIGPQRVPAVEQAARAVDAFLPVVLVLEGAEHPVPEDQDAAVVLVQVDVIHRVVHAVVAGAAEPAVEPAQAPDLLGVHPELVEQVHQRHDGEHQRRHAGQRHGHVEHPAQQCAGAGLAQRGRQVVVLALVVHRMRGPEHGRLVAHAVQPVVAKIVEHQRQQPARHAEPEGVIAPQRQVLEHGGVDAHAQEPGEHRAGLAQHPEADAADGIGHAVGHALALVAHRQFDGDQQKEDGCGKDDDLAGAHWGECSVSPILAPIRSARLWHQP